MDRLSAIQMKEIYVSKFTEDKINILKDKPGWIIIYSNILGFECLNFTQKFGMVARELLR